MPSKKAAAEWLANEVAKGRGDESCHIVDVTADQKKRIKNEKRKQNFVLCTGDPDICSEFEFEKDRIFRKVHNKSVMLSLMARAWRDALSDAELDKILAVMEGPDV
jgi:hypothetical protein